MPLYLSMVLTVTFVQTSFFYSFPFLRLKGPSLNWLFMYNSHRFYNIPNAGLSSFHRVLQNNINPRPRMVWQKIASDIGTTSLVKIETNIASILKGLDIVF